MSKDLRVKNKISSRTISMIYHHWIHEIVNKGKANDYIILEYPDLVQLIIINPDGKREKDKIIERRTAMMEVEKFPDTFDLVEVDIKELIANDIKRSDKIANKFGVYKSRVSFLSRILRTIRIKIYPKITLTKKPIVDLLIMIIGTIAAYAIMKYVFGWF